MCASLDVFTWPSLRESRLQEFVQFAVCLLLSKTAFHYSAALMISSATSFGNDSIATWLDGTSIAVALAAFTWSLSICGGMIASFVATTMKVGFSRHAAWLIGAVRVLTWNGPSVAATTACSWGERSAAKYLLMPSSLIVR